MKLAVVCANGRVGTLVVKEALGRGLDVTAVVRGENRTEAKNVIGKDLFDLAAGDLEGFDVVVDAFGAWKEITGHSLYGSKRLSVLYCMKFIPLLSLRWMMLGCL